MSSGAENRPQPTQEGDIKDQAELDNFEQTKPGKDNKVILVNNPGNPVFSCPTEVSTHTTESQEEDCFEGYSVKKQNPMYMTSAMEYGSRRPTVHTMPNSFHAKCQKFTDHLGKCGMYRNQSLNTSMDKSIV